MYIVWVLSVLITVVSSRQCNVTIDLDVKWIVDCSSMDLVHIPSAIPVEPIISLKLRNNSLSNLLNRSFSNWTSILELDLSMNKISVIYNDTFNGLADLISLNLSSNSLKYFTPNITNSLASLKYLDLSNNIIKVIGPGTFQPIKHLQKLFLANNFGLGDHLSQFSALEISLDQGLRSLDLSNTTLKDIPDDFLYDAPHLNSIYLSNNLLTQVPLLPKSLKYLDMSKNPIEELPDGCFEHSLNLQTIVLNSLVNLREVPEGALKGLDKLTALSIQDCPRLVRFAGEVFGMSSPRLKKISLNNCQLTTLHENLQQYLEDVEYLDLQANPWTCDESIAWIISMNIGIDLLQDLRCNAPEDVQGMTLKDYYSPLKKVQTSSFWIHAIIFTSIVVVCLCAVVGMIKHLAKQRAENYLMLQNMGAPQVPSRNLNELLH